jgi:hypothetical protein
MVVLTTLFSALPVLARFGRLGTLGVGAGIAATTAYRALATPVMMYALSALAWWTVTRFAARAPFRRSTRLAAPTCSTKSVRT